MNPQISENAQTSPAGVSLLHIEEPKNSDNTGINLVEIQDLSSAPQPTATQAPESAPSPEPETINPAAPPTAPPQAIISRAPQPLPPSLATCLADMKRNMEGNGLHFKGELIADHTLHRYHGEGDKPGSKNIWAIVHPDDHPNGVFGCHKRLGKEAVKWKLEGGVRITDAERKALMAKMTKDQAKRDVELKAGYEAATKLAKRMLDAAAPATDDHAYLKSKHVKAPTGVKVGTWIKEGKGRPLEIADALLVPMFCFDNAATEGEDPRPLVAAQAIFVDDKNPLERGKDFITGGRKQGTWFAIGHPLDKDGVKIAAICEGLSTGAAIFESTGIGVIVAFDRTNLIHVAQAWKNQYPKSSFILSADNDWTDGNPGLTDATKAAEAIGAPVVKPEFENTEPDPKTGKRPTDFNDLATREGAEAVKRRFEPAIAAIMAKAAEPAPAPEATPVSIAAPGSADILILARNAHMNSAREFLRRNYQLGDKTTMRSQSGLFYEWDGHCYPESDRDVVKGQLWQFLDRAMIRAEGNKLENYLPDLKLVANVMAGVEAKTILHRNVQAPTWLDGCADAPAASELVACRNGLLHLPTRELYPHTPDFWTHNALDYDFQPDAPEPKQWMALLQQIWGYEENGERKVDLDSINALQELFGYCLSADTSQQKIFLLVGTRRSGKGTVGRVLTRLLGPANVAAPTLQSMCGEFGLQPLINKSAALIGDARIGHRHDQAAIAERLLSISGEDAITVNRKNIIAWTGRLGVRFVILTNETPRVSDASGALASRFIILRFIKSFYGKEGTSLSEKLFTELPGILNWAIEGWVNLQKRGHFVQPESSLDAIKELEELGSPVLAFVNARCEIGPGHEETLDALFNEWDKWCGGEARRERGTKAMFGRDLQTAVPGIIKHRARANDSEEDHRLTTYRGIRLAKPF